MDNSLIPRAFSPTDAKREREANAREAERRTSARNTSASAIPEGGKLTLAGGGIDIVEGGTVEVIGSDYDAATGAAYEVTATLGSEEYIGGSGTTQRKPGMFFADTLRKVKASLQLSVGNLFITADNAATGESALVGASPQQVRANYYVNSGTSSKDHTFTANSAGLKLNYSENREGVYYTGMVQLRDGKATIAASHGIELTGDLTNNGAPISGGGGGASSWDELTGKPTTFPPTAHAHPISDVTGLETRLVALDASAPTEITYASGYSFYGTTYRHAQYLKQGNIARLLGMVGCTASTISMTSGTLYTLGSIPLSIAPAADELFGVIVSGFANRTGQLYVQTDGSIKFTPHQTFTGITKGQFYIMLGDAWWPV